jgi:1-acyl-sn-glycerol-3-phosphate acyltransferase
MDALPYGTPPRWWPPRLSRFWMRVLRAYRLTVRHRRQERLLGVDVRGADHVRRALADGCGVLITPKHYGHADAFVMLEAAEQVGRPFTYLVGWQVFQLLSPVGRWVLQRHGCFSIDREGHDLRAFRQAVALVKQGRNPLVVFTEGEIYHNGDKVYPFRTGAAMIGLTAAKRGERPVVCVPAALRYRLAEDPTPHLLPLMARLEDWVTGRTRPGRPLAARLRAFAHDLLALRERQYLGHEQQGAFAERISDLTEAMLRRLEGRHGERTRDLDVPDRVTQLRRRLIKLQEEAPEDDPRRAGWREEMDELFVVTQLYSYLHDWDEDELSPERMAELCDKFEEDVLGAPTATVRAAKRASVLFGPPVAVPRVPAKREAARALTDTLQARVQELVDELRGVRVPAARRQPAAVPQPTPA